jgi:cold shock CspA family protein
MELRGALNQSRAVQLAASNFDHLSRFMDRLREIERGQLVFERTCSGRSGPIATKIIKGVG